jgi:hypothetical protein
MTQQDLGQDLGHDLGQDLEAPGELGSLFDASPAPEVQTSAAAEAGFVLGLFALLAMPFALALVLSVGLAAVALVCSIFGLARHARAGRPALRRHRHGLRRRCRADAAQLAGLSQHAAADPIARCRSPSSTRC